MDFQFPRQLFPSFYNCGPPDSRLQYCAGNWGSYDRVIAQGSSGPLSSWTYASRHQVRGASWRHKEPVPIPLLSPRNTVLWPVEPPDPLDFREHMRNFFIDHPQDAFGRMGEILSKNLDFEDGSDVSHQKNLVNMWRVVEYRNYKINPKSWECRTLDGYSALLSDVVHTVSPELLGGLLYGELTEQRDRLLFSEGTTGGALAFIPSSQSPERGCLIYPGNPGLDCLNFHQVELQHHREGSPCVDASSSSDMFRFQLKGPVRQISSASLVNQSCVAVRSDYLCGVWGLSETNEPHLHQVVNTREVATCISVSPHVLGEVLVASESGTANLWTIGRGTQKVREEDSNLYFNAKSSWRWCEFSAHPRVMLYADRTGVELTDIRASPAVCHTLFRISKTSECRNGERLILSKYLREAHPFHHLITTQYSAYVMDERFPIVPMLKWDHMMQSPPMFCHVIPGSSSVPSAGGAGTTKVLLGSHSSQEITLLQYSGGRTDACSSRGPPQALLRTRDSLKHLPVQIPHHLETATNRLSSPAAGLTCIQMKGEREEGDEECLCVLQLTEAGDIFYQFIESERPDISEDESLQLSPKETKQPEKPQTDSQMVVSETSSDEDIIAPTLQRSVPETPERIQRGVDIYTDTSSEDSQSEGWKRRKLKRLNLQVIINDDPEPDTMNGVVDKCDGDGELGKNTNEEPGSIEETVDSRSPGHVVPPQVQLSDSARGTWNHWLKKLMKRSCKKKPQPHQLEYFEVQADGVFPLAKDQERDSEEERVQNLRRDLRACMSKQALLVHTSVSDSITAPDVDPLPNTVVTDAWEDQLSQRLTFSWQGEEAWRAWWENSLGLNREQRIDALRRKRRKAKEAKRASGRRLELSGSFTSSISYQSELSASQGWSSPTSQELWWSSATSQELWSSAMSQELCSDAESIRSQAEGLTESGSPRATTPLQAQTDGPPPATPQSVHSKPDEQQTPSSSRTPPQTLRPISTWSSLRTNKRPAEDVLSSLVEPSQHDSHPPDSMVWPASPPVAASPQLRSSQPLSQRSLGKDLSQDSLVWSVSQPFSQSSQGRPGLSRSSQPKKKARMGF